MSLLADAMATEEWKKEVQKHEQYIKDLEEKFKTKCEQMKVVNCDYTKKDIKIILNFIFPKDPCSTFS